MSNLLLLHPFLDGRIDRAPRVPLAHDLRGDALADFALAPTIRQQGIGGPAQHVDEARRHRQALGVHHVFCRRPGQVSDGGDAIAGNSHVSSARRVARPVVHRASANQRIEVFAGRCADDGNFQVARVLGVLVERDVSGARVAPRLGSHFAAAVVVLFEVDRIRRREDEPQAAPFLQATREEVERVEHVALDCPGLDQLFLTQRLAVRARFRSSASAMLVPSGLIS